MPRLKKWRTVCCVNDSVRFHRDRAAAYAFVGKQPPGRRFRVQRDEQMGAGWEDGPTLVSTGEGVEEE